MSKLAPNKPLGLLAWLLIAGGLISMLASILLAIEVFNRLKNPAFVPICNLSPILSCTSVADSPQSHLLGIPNYFIGIAGYGAMTAVGFALLAGATFRRWFWRGLNLGLSGAIIFITWLQFESLYRISALCIFCMVVWAASWPLFWYVTIYNLRQGNIRTPKILLNVKDFTLRNHLNIFILWYVVIIALILKRFWYYWSSFI